MLALSARAQVVYFKENTARDAQGKPTTKAPIQAISIKKTGDNLVITRQVGAGQVNETVPMSSVLQVAFPEPGQIRAANDLLTQNQPEAALAQIDPIVTYHAQFREIPGNRWADAAIVKIYALLALNREQEAEALIGELGKAAADPDYPRAATIALTGSYLKKQQYKRVVEVLDPIVKDCQRADLLADAWVKKGQAHLALRQPELALRAF